VTTILHGTWLLGEQRFFLWGETDERTGRRGRQPKQPQHPAQRDPAGLRELLGELLPWAAPEHEQTIWLPSAGGAPLPLRELRDAGADVPPGEPELAPWRVRGLLLSAAAATELLIDIGELRCLGSDLRCWHTATLLAMDLVVGQQLMPTLARAGHRLRARWQPRPVPATAGKISALARALPALCRAVAATPEAAPGPRALVDGFLAAAVDALARSLAADDQAMAAQLASWRSETNSPGAAWMAALVGPEPELALNVRLGDELFKAWQDWAGLEHVAGDESFRITFRLEPPADAGAPWALSYMLQATDDPSLLVPAAQLWRERGDLFTYLDRRFDRPQERLLRGLGFAARFCPPIERSLSARAPDHAELSLGEAFSFLKDAAPLLEQSGFGVLVPAWWGGQGRIRARARTGERKIKRGDHQGRLSFSSMISFSWELSLGGQPIDRDEFERLVALKQPLVQVRGEWVVLDPAQARDALALFGRGGEMTVAEALRMGLGGVTPQLPPGVTYEGLEAHGELGALLSGLSDAHRLEELPQPADFEGTLRPYQRRGFSWLAFMRRYGMGACLADDMGLGKCLCDTNSLVVNGTLRTAAQIWQNYAGEAAFDGEGFWADPREELLINAIDTDTGKIILAPIRKLYRQQVREALRTVRLEDGSSITITRRHKLLTSTGWTNELKVGDYVCVPSHMLWEGQPADHNLVRLLAWQIAEGHELANKNRLVITQKDQGLLHELLELVRQIGHQHALDVHKPAVRIHSNGTSHILVMSSSAYRAFLEAQGYQWGKRSAQKAIPDFIMQADADSVRVFLRNYFDAEASAIPSMGSIEIASASSTLMQQLVVLLRRFGIWMRVSEKRKRATNGSGIFRTYQIGVIGGNAARLFAERIGFGSAEKQRKLEAICAKPVNTNVEGVPASALVAKGVAASRLPVRMFGMHNTVCLDGSQQFSRASLARVAGGMDQILSGRAEQEYREKKGSKWTAQTLAAFDGLDAGLLGDTRREVQRLLDQEVLYCRIESIEDLQHEGWVYDFEVARHHNFVAENIVCHNTAQAIALFLHERETAPDAGPTLLVAPTSVVGNWQRELARFAPTLRVLAHQGAERERGDELARAAADHDVVITSYPLLARDREALTAAPWRLAVLDEAQNIKNSDTRQAQAARALQAQARIALTGTPVENRLTELWSIMAFLNPGYLGGETEFRRTFARPIERAGDPQAAARLRNLTAPFILRRLKTDPSIISDLPEKQEMKVYVPLTAEQATLYEAAVRDALREIEDADGTADQLKRRGLVLAMLTRLKQICNHPAHFLKDGSPLGDRSGKLARLDEMLEEVLAANDRALIFTQFAEMGTLLQGHFAGRLLSDALFLHGGTPARERDAMVRRFQAPEGPQLFILSLKAGGVGLNLTHASHVFHFDRWWNPAVEDQATDRAFRIGQKRNVQVHKFVCSGTLEEKIDEMIEGKRALVAQVLGAGEGWLTELSTSQLRELVALRHEDVAA
jgi:intein/homing endonuclease